jgi:hypothetical protein
VLKEKSKYINAPIKDHIAIHHISTANVIEPGAGLLFKKMIPKNVAAKKVSKSTNTYIE